MEQENNNELELTETDINMRNVFYIYGKVICIFKLSLTYSFRMISGDDIEMKFRGIVCVLRLTSSG